jgi:hypothetical protein
MVSADRPVSNFWHKYRSFTRARVSYSWRIRDPEPPDASVSPISNSRGHRCRHRAPRQAEVLDLSLGGALVEHQGQLRVGAPCFIGLPTNGSAEEVLQAIIRSFGAPKDRRPRKTRKEVLAKVAGRCEAGQVEEGSAE